MDRDLGKAALLGTLMGAGLSATGFSSWDEAHGMIDFSNGRLMLGFAGGVGLLALLWLLLAQQRRWRGQAAPRWPPRPLHAGTVPGGLLFGCGWALCGTCPSTVFVQLGEGQLIAVLTLVGIVLGNWLFALMHGPVFRFSINHSCSGE